MSNTSFGTVACAGNCVWMVIVLLAVIFSGFKLFGFELGDSVLVAFIVSLTANSTVLLYFALKV